VPALIGCAGFPLGFFARLRRTTPSLTIAHHVGVAFHHAHDRAAAGAHSGHVPGFHAATPGTVLV
jgi:hypothetical protein